MKLLFIIIAVVIIAFLIWIFKEEGSAPASAVKAAEEISSKPMKNPDSDAAVRIQRLITQKNIRINTSCLNRAHGELTEILRYAERLKKEVLNHPYNGRYLKSLYGQGVGLSNRLHNLRVEVKSIQDSLYKISRSNRSLEPLYKQVYSFCSVLYHNEVELNRRNSCLRMYITQNLDSAWGDKIERLKRQRRANERQIARR